MDPITAIMTAITLGVATGLTETAKQAIVDTYASLKKILRERHDIRLGNLEEDPESKKETDLIKESLSARTQDALSDKELIHTAQQVIEKVNQYKDQQPEYIRNLLENGISIKIGITKSKVGGSVNLDEIHSIGGIEIGIDDTTIEKDLTISNMSSGEKTETARGAKKKQKRQ